MGIPWHGSALTGKLLTVSFQAHEAVIHGHHPAPEENLQVLAALRLQYLQGDYTLHAAVPPLEEVYSLQRLKARISQSTKTFTPCERLEKRRTSFLEGTLRRSFRTGSVVRQKVEEEQMLDMWIKEEVSSARASIIDKWKKFQGMNQEQAMAKYMALIKEWPGYGSTLFDVEVRTGGRVLGWAGCRHLNMHHGQVRVERRQDGAFCSLNLFYSSPPNCTINTSLLLTVSLLLCSKCICNIRNECKIKMSSILLPFLREAIDLIF